MYKIQKWSYGHADLTALQDLTFTFCTWGPSFACPIRTGFWLNTYTLHSLHWHTEPHPSLLCVLFLPHNPGHVCLGIFRIAMLGYLVIEIGYPSHLHSWQSFCTPGRRIDLRPAYAKFECIRLRTLITTDFDLDIHNLRGAKRVRKKVGLDQHECTSHQKSTRKWIWARWKSTVTVFNAKSLLSITYHKWTSHRMSKALYHTSHN